MMIQDYPNTTQISIPTVGKQRFSHDQGSNQDRLARSSCPLERGGCGGSWEEFRRLLASAESSRAICKVCIIPRIKPRNAPVTVAAGLVLNQ
jgi:hypothetical protein